MTIFMVVGLSTVQINPYKAEGVHNTPRDGLDDFSPKCCIVRC